MPRTLCYRCGRSLQGNKVFYVAGFPVGRACYSLIERRALIRARGPNSRVVVHPETKRIHLISDWAVVCPSDQEHCIECSFSSNKVCPIERFLESQ